MIGIFFWQKKKNSSYILFYVRNEYQIEIVINIKNSYAQRRDNDEERTRQIYEDMHNKTLTVISRLHDINNSNAE